MKGVLGNSCAKGCLIYVVALVIIVAVTAFGLGGLRARFAGSNQGAQISAQGNGPSPASFGTAAPQTIPQQPTQQAAGQAAGQGAGSSTGQAPASAYSPAPTQPPAQPVPPSPPDVPQPASTPPSAPQSAPQVFTPSEAQGGAVSGEASAPFYVVQGGDTLWEISQRFGLDAGTLRVINNLPDTTIYPGQTLILSQGGVSQQPPQDGSSEATTPGGSVANNTGANGAAPEPGTTLPNMPDTGINRKP